MATIQISTILQQPRIAVTETPGGVIMLEIGTNKDDVAIFADSTEGLRRMGEAILKACDLNCHECIIEDGERRTPEGEAARAAIAKAEGKAKQ